MREALDGRLFVTIREAANLLGLCQNTVRAAIYDGRLCGARMAVNGPVRIWIRELAQFICACEAKSLPMRAPPRRKKPNRKWS